MNMEDYIELYEMIQDEDDIDMLQKMAVYLLVNKMVEDKNVSEEEVQAFIEYAAINIGTLEETIH
jgi:predicted nucleotidyltransferase